MTIKTKSKAVTKKSNPSISGIQAWAPPYPASKLDKDGKTEMVLVRAVPTRDIRVNGTLLPVGVEVTLPCNVAHANAASLTSPKE